MDKYVTANDVRLDKGNKQSTMRASIGGLEVGRNGLRPPSEKTAWDPRPGGRKGACEKGRKPSQAKETRQEGPRAGEMLFVAEVW